LVDGRGEEAVCWFVGEMYLMEDKFEVHLMEGRGVEYRSVGGIVVVTDNKHRREVSEVWCRLETLGTIDPRRYRQQRVV
jgi:hypothetical protein